MGKGGRNFYQGNRRIVATDIGSDTERSKCEPLASQRGVKTLNKSLESLNEKRGSTRESALSAIIQSFSLGYQYRFADKNFSTLLYHCLNSFKKGSVKESCLAVEALALLAITVGCGENGHELHREVVPVLSQALNSESPPLKLKLILECLAIVTFVGGNELEETEKSMQSIWNFMHSESNCKETHSAAVSAWSLLLSTMDSWTVSCKHWQGAIPFFMNLQQVDDESIPVTASQALALILEVGVEKFEGDPPAEEELNVNKVLKDGLVAETSVKVGKQILKVDTLPQLLQLNFLKRLLGSGFAEHMRENELLQSVFAFKPEKRRVGRELYVADRDEVAINLFVPDVRREASVQRLRKSQNSIFVKAKTQIRNKNRDIRGEELWSFED